MPAWRESASPFHGPCRPHDKRTGVSFAAAQPTSIRIVEAFLIDHPVRRRAGQVRRARRRTVIRRAADPPAAWRRALRPVHSELTFRDPRRLPSGPPRPYAPAPAKCPPSSGRRAAAGSDPAGSTRASPVACPSLARRDESVSNVPRLAIFSASALQFAALAAITRRGSLSRFGSTVPLNRSRTGESALSRMSVGRFAALLIPPPMVSRSMALSACRSTCARVRLRSSCGGATPASPQRSTLHARFDGSVRRSAQGQPVGHGPDWVRRVRSTRSHRDIAPAAWPPPPRSSWTGWPRTRMPAKGSPPRVHPPSSRIRSRRTVALAAELADPQADSRKLSLPSCSSDFPKSNAVPEPQRHARILEDVRSPRAILDGLLGIVRHEAPSQPTAPRLSPATAWIPP